MFIFALAYCGRNFTFIFFGELKKPKSPFEINWPLSKKIMSNQEAAGQI
jgi:hypothetical protein